MWVSIPALSMHLTPNLSGSTRILQMGFSPSTYRIHTQFPVAVLDPGRGAWMEQTQGFRDLLGFDGAPLPRKHWDPSAEHICNGTAPQLCSQEASLVMLARDEPERLSFPTQHICVSHIALDGCL